MTDTDADGETRDEQDPDLDHLSMLYPELVDRAMRSQGPVTEIRELGTHRRVYSAAQFDLESEIVWRANITDYGPEFDSAPNVTFSTCCPTASPEIMQEWTSIATGRLSGPQKLAPWESLFAVFNAALRCYNQEGRADHAE